MHKGEILKKIEAVVRDVLDDDLINLNNKSSTESIEAWDSLAHINIIIQIEKDFKIKFSLDEISELSSVEKIIDAIDKK